jgi:hypothetical protein
MFLAAATLAVTVTPLLVPPVLHTQITKPAEWPARTREEPDSDWTWTHSCGLAGDGLVPDGDGLGLVGLGLDGGLLDGGADDDDGGGAWLVVGPADDDGGSGDGEVIVLSEGVGVAPAAVVVPDGPAAGSVADAEGLMAAARTAVCGRLAHAVGTACARCGATAAPNA